MGVLGNISAFYELFVDNAFRALAYPLIAVPAALGLGLTIGSVLIGWYLSLFRD